jgi:hypothetical protein
MDFPPELRDLIVDCLRTDTAALRACSLTCRAWLHRARHHLFRYVHIHPGRRGDAFKVLLDETPEIGKYIREVEISAFGNDVAVVDVSGRWPTLDNLAAPLSRPVGCNPTSATWLQNVLPESTKILSKVSALKLLSLPITIDLAQVLSAHFRRVTVVNLDYCRAETFGELLSLPRALTEVRCLRLDGVTWFRPVYSPPNGNIVARPCSLKSIVLTEKVDSATVINWLVEQRRYTALTSLSCYLSSDASAVAVQKLLDAVGPLLHDLAIGFSDVRDPTGTCEP